MNQHSAKPSANAAIDPIFEAACRGNIAALLDREDPRCSAGVMAAWHGDPVNQRKLDQLRALFESQAKLLAAQARTEVIFGLLAVIRSETSKPEVIRKACLDLLKMSEASSASERTETRASKPDSARTPATRERSQAAGCVFESEPDSIQECHDADGELATDPNSPAPASSPAAAPSGAGRPSTSPQPAMPPSPPVKHSQSPGGTSGEPHVPIPPVRRDRL